MDTIFFVLVLLHCTGSAGTDITNPSGARPIDSSATHDFSEDFALVHYVIGQLDFGDLGPSRAFRLLDHGLRQSPNNPVLLYGRSQVNHRCGYYGRSLSDILQAIRHMNTSGLDWKFAGKCYGWLGSIFSELRDEERRQNAWILQTETDPGAVDIAWIAVSEVSRMRWDGKPNVDASVADELWSRLPDTLEDYREAWRKAYSMRDAHGRSGVYVARGSLRTGLKRVHIGDRFTAVLRHCGVPDESKSESPGDFEYSYEWSKDRTYAFEFENRILTEIRVHNRPKEVLKPETWWDHYSCTIMIILTGTCVVLVIGGGAYVCWCVVAKKRGRKAE